MLIRQTSLSLSSFQNSDFSLHFQIESFTQARFENCNFTNLLGKNMGD